MRGHSFGQPVRMEVTGPTHSEKDYDQHACYLFRGPLKGPS